MKARARPVIEVVDDWTAGVMRRRTPAERLEIAFGLWTSTHLIITSMLKRLHPEWTDDQLAAEVARRLSHGAV